jgi:uncharacterized protein YuzE
MSDLQISMELEDEDGSAYLQLRTAEIAKTKRITDKVMVDFSANGEVVGVEFIFHSLKTATMPMFLNKGISEDDLKTILRMLVSQASTFKSKSAGIWQMPKGIFQSSTQPQLVFTAR